MLLCPRTLGLSPLTPLLRSSFNPAVKIVSSTTVPAIYGWRDGECDWHHFEYTLRAAAAFAHDMRLLSEKGFSGRAFPLRQFVPRRFGCPAVTMRVFTDNLSNTRGLTKSKVDHDLKDGRAIQKVLGIGVTVGTEPPNDGTRGRGFYGAYALRGYAAPAETSSQRAPPVGFAPLAAGGVTGRRGSRAAGFAPRSRLCSRSHRTNGGPKLIGWTRTGIFATVLTYSATNAIGYPQ